MRQGCVVPSGLRRATGCASPVIPPGFVPSLSRDYAAAGFRIAKAWTLLESNRTEGGEGLDAVWVPTSGGFKTTPDEILPRHHAK